MFSKHWAFIFFLYIMKINYILASIVNCKILPNYVASIISRKPSSSAIRKLSFVHRGTQKPLKC